MDAVTIMKYGHITIESQLANLQKDKWLSSGVCGYWSVKDIIAHLASFEWLFVDILASLLEDESPTPVLDRFLVNDKGFNDDEVARRQEMSADEVWVEYETGYTKALALLEKVPLEDRRVKGSLPWYGNDYDLEDLIVYTCYGHKREHAAQIAVFQDSLQ